MSTGQGRFSISAVFKAVDEMTRPIGRIKSAVDSFAASSKKTLGELDGHFSAVASGFQGLAVAGAAAGTAIGYLGKSVLETGMDFEQQITNTAAVSLKTRDQIKDLEKEALRLGAETKFSATEAAEGMELMARAGATNQDILSGIGGILSAAAAEGIELAETAGHVSNALKGMGLEWSESARVADVLTLASAETNSSISSLGESLANVSATASQFNIPLEQAVASVALLQDVGLDASVAGSAFNTMLNSLAKPTDAVRAKMRKMGISFQDAKGDMLPLTDVFANLQKAADKAGGNMKVAAFFADLVGLRGQKAAANLQKLFKKGKVQELFVALEGAAGKAELMASIKMDTLRGDMDELSSAVDAVKISIYDAQSGPLRGLAQDTRAWVDANKDLVATKVTDFLKDTVTNLPAIWTWTKRIGVTVGTFYAISTAVKAAKVATEAYLGVTKGFGFAVDGIRAASVAVGLFNAEVAKVEGGLTGWRAGLNAGALSKQINSVESQLGQAGLLGAALAVGYAFGSWLDHTFKLSDKLTDVMLQITGINKALDAAGGKRDTATPDPKGNKHYADGSVRDSKGVMIRPPDDPKYETLYQKRNKRLAPYKGPLTFDDATANQTSRWASEYFRKPYDSFAEDRRGPMSYQMVPPEVRAAQTISEMTTTSTAEVTIKDESGKATITKKPKRGAMNLKLQPTGAF
jgi:TP901 family phage tail tape measure protein